MHVFVCFEQLMKSRGKDGHVGVGLVDGHEQQTDEAPGVRRQLQHRQPLPTRPTEQIGADLA
jgi:hypothetical protein